MNQKLSDYVKKNYADAKADLFTCFMERCHDFTKKDSYQAMITQHAWMFLSSFEKFRIRLLSHNTIINMAHLGARAFEEIGGEVVPTTAFVLQPTMYSDYKGTYARLVEPTSQQGKEDMFLDGKNRYIINQILFSRIPGSPISYWLSSQIISCFSLPKIYDFALPCKGMDTGDNNRFIRLWPEIQLSEIFIPKGQVFTYYDLKVKKWFPYNKGGSYRKWYGNNDSVVDWSNNGQAIKKFAKSNIRNEHEYFKEGITWSKITSSKSSFRYFMPGFIFDNGSSSLFSNKYLAYIQGFLNSKVCETLLSLQPTLNTQLGNIGNLPLKICDSDLDIELLVKSCREISKADWDAFETSWDFQRHPLVRSVDTVEEAFSQWKEECEDRFQKLKGNEEELNRIFIHIYGLEDELTPEEEDKDVTVRKADLGRDIRSLISYGVGCILGRYSLNTPGLAYAGGEWDSTKYKTFHPDGRFTKEEVEDILKLSLEMRRRVKEQLKKIGGMEFYDVNFSYIDNDSFEEKYVSVPEQGSGSLIPDGMVSPGQVYTIGASSDGRIGCYRLESQILEGNGKFEKTGLGSGHEAKEAANTAFNYLKANGKRISGAISTDTKNFIVNYQDLNGIGMTSTLALPTLISLSSIALGKPVISSAAVIGEISIGGSITRP